MNILVLGPLEQAQLTEFYNAIEQLIFSEASYGNKACQHYRLCRCWQRTVASLKKILYRVWSDGRRDLKQKGRAARQRGLQLFTAKKMVAAYERLFLCISNDEKIGENYCQFQIP
ncbi:hypothetical protein ACFX2I_006138 [Malus domestica]